MENKTGEKKMNLSASGLFFGVVAYLIWGFIPIYWKQIDHVPAIEVLAHRIIWCAVFMLIFVVVTGRMRYLSRACITLWNDKKRLLKIIIATTVVNANWFTYIWAVAHDKIVDASLGYYINPLVSVFLGAFFLRERLSFWQWTAFVLSCIGVIAMGVGVGSLPVVAIVLALTFGLYGLLKKQVNIDATSSLTIETVISSVFALAVLAFYVPDGAASFNMSADPRTSLFLIGAGLATAIPLLLFGLAALSLPLFVVGFIQYISPTIGLLLGVFMYHEPFELTQLLAFTFIWIGIIVFSLSGLPVFKRAEEKILARFKKK